MSVVDDEAIKLALTRTDVAHFHGTKMVMLAAGVYHIMTVCVAASWPLAIRSALSRALVAIIP